MGVAKGVAISNAVAAGMAGGIINSATQLALTGDVDLTQALASAGTAALGNAFSGVMSDPAVIDSVGQSQNTILDGVDVGKGVDNLAGAIGGGVTAQEVLGVIDAVGPIAAGIVFGSPSSVLTGVEDDRGPYSVSYTHLTLPTIYSV